MASPSDDQRRYERYRRVVEAAVVRETFTLEELKAACAPEQPAFVTRVVTQLEGDGYLVRSGTKSRPSFRWESREGFSASRWIDDRVFAPRMARTPACDRPRERLVTHGAASLRTAELLAILIRSGRPGESALQAGEKIAARYGEHLEQLPQAGRAELKAISPAVAETAYCQIMAGIELGRRVAAAASGQSRQQRKRILGPEDAIEECNRRFARLAENAVQEEFYVLCLNTKHEVVSSHRISVGSLDASLVHPREVFRPAVKEAAAAIILVHNHPSGDPTPSRQDLAITERLEQVGRTLGIDVLDHIVVARRSSLSVREYRQSGAIVQLGG